MAKPSSRPVPPELLAAVLAHPDDDGARHVFADALIERGDPRGEFITVQCEIARRGGKETKATKPLWNRFRALHSRHSGKWAKSLRALGKRTTWQFHRGFVRRLRVNVAPPLGPLADLLTVEPVTELVAEYPPLAWLRSALALPGAERLRRLAILYTDTPHATNLARLFGTVSLPHLAHLRIGLFGDKPVSTLATTARLPALRHLAIGGGGYGVDLTATGVAALASSALAAQLTVLELGRTTMTPALVAIVTGMKQLEKFSASYGEFDKVTRAALEARFGKSGFIVESEASFDYLLDGVRKLSC